MLRSKSQEGILKACLKRSVFKTPLPPPKKNTKWEPSRHPSRRRSRTGEAQLRSPSLWPFCLVGFGEGTFHQILLAMQIYVRREGPSSYLGLKLYRTLEGVTSTLNWARNTLGSQYNSSNREVTWWYLIGLINRQVATSWTFCNLWCLRGQLHITVIEWDVTSS